MRNITFFTILFTSLLLVSCHSAKESTEHFLKIDISHSEPSQAFSITFTTGKGFNHPTFVIWTEDADSNYLSTLFITQSFASGIFGHEMMGDSAWKASPGPSYQPAALPFWLHKKGLIDDKYLIPSPEHPFVDAYTGATPTANFELIANSLTTPFRLLVEVNQTWDWNAYWTNNKYPDSYGYKHSAQPSLVYEVLIDDAKGSYELKPIGHGDAKGESGRLFTDLSTLTTAKEIFKNIKVEFSK